MTSTMTSPSARPQAVRTSRSATVLVATDGKAQSDGALRVALARAAEMGAQLAVLTVAAPEPIATPEMPFSVWSDAMLFARTALREAVQAQLARVTCGEPARPVTLLDGSPAFSIARVAREQRAALVVIGLGRHNVVDRLFSDETALQLARISRVPVLAVPATAHGVPRHAIVAVDFSSLSANAAQAAIDAVGEGGRVELVHIVPRVHADAFAIEAQEPLARWAAGELGQLALQLVVPDGVKVSTVVLHGRPAPAILDYASHVGADLVVTGTHGRGFVARALLGSVTSQLIRAATCAVLTVPRDPLPVLNTADRNELGLTGAEAQQEWGTMLTNFTVRNLGRRTILEVDDLEIGAQAQEFNYPLIAVMFDPREKRVQIMLGDRTPTGRHLVRSIGAVIGIDLLTDATGHDQALRIEHGTGQTLLTFAA